MNLWQIFVNVVVKGKAKRLPRGLFFIYLVAVIMAFYGLSALLVGIESLIGHTPALLWLVMIAAFICCIIFEYKLVFLRLHDTNHSGYYWFIGFIPVIGTFWLLFTLLLEPGTDGNNNYGAPFRYDKKTPKQNKDTN